MLKYFLIATLLLWVSLSMQVQAQVIRCTQPNGIVEYQDHACATLSADAKTNVQSTDLPSVAEPLEKYGIDQNCQNRLERDATQCNKSVADSLAQCTKLKLSPACAGEAAAPPSVKRDRACVKEIEAANFQCIPQSQSAIEQCLKASGSAKCTQQKIIMENNFSKQQEDQTACLDKSSKTDCPN